MQGLMCMTEDPSPDISEYDCRHHTRKEECLIEKSLGEQKIHISPSMEKETSTALLGTNRENGAWNRSEKDNFKITLNSSGRFLMNTAISVTVDFNPQLMSEVGVKCIDDNSSEIKSLDSEIKSSQNILMEKYYSQGTYTPQREHSQNNCEEKWNLWHHSKANDVNEIASQTSPTKKRVLSSRTGATPNKRRKSISPQKNKIYNYFVRTDDIRSENTEETSEVKNVSLFHSNKDQLYYRDINKHSSNGIVKNREKHCSESSDVIVISSDEEIDLPVCATKAEYEEKPSWPAHSDIVDLCEDTLPVHTRNKRGQKVPNSINVSNSSNRKNVDEVVIISSDEDDNLCFSSQKVIGLTSDLCSSDDAGGVIVPESNNFKKGAIDTGYFDEDEDDDDDDDCISVISYQPDSISGRKSEEVVCLEETVGSFSLQEKSETRDCKFSACANQLAKRSTSSEGNMECEKRLSVEEHCSNLKYMGSLGGEMNVIDSSLNMQDGNTTDSSLPSPPHVSEDYRGMLDSESEEGSEIVSSSKVSDQCIPSFDEMVSKCSGREDSEERKNDENTSDEENEKSFPKRIIPSAARVCQVQAEVLLSKIYQPWIDLETDEVPQCCIMGPAVCNSLHGKKERWPEETDYYDEYLILRMVNGTGAVDFLQSRLDFLVYPSTSDVQNLLFGCMNLWTEGVTDALSWLRHLLRLHPPCAFGMLEYYKKVFFNPVMDMRAPDGTFWFCVTKIEETMNAMEKQSSVNDVAVRTSSDKNESYDFIETFLKRANSPLSSEKQVVDFKQSDKLRQLFDILDYLICVLEADLDMGLLKNISNLKRYTCKTGRPLIAVAIWGTHRIVGNVNTKCRHLMKMYLRVYENYRDIGYHRNFKRLISLMAGVTYASERNSEPPMYPNIESNCKDFAGTFASIVMTTALNMMNVRQILETLRPDWFRVCVCCNLIEKLYGRSIELSLKPTVMLLQSLHALRQDYPSDEEIIETILSEPDTTNITSEDADEVPPDYVKYAKKKDRRGETRLHIACRRNNIEQVERLLKVPNISINEEDNEGWTPLHEASFHGSVECVKKLLSYRTPSGGPAIDLRARSKGGVTPLMDAVSRGHLEVASVLLQQGGVKLLSDENNEGQSVWDLARTEDMRKVFRSAENLDLLKIPRTLYVKLAVLTPLAILYYIKFSEVTRIAHYLKHNTELSRDRALLVKFQPLTFKQDFIQFMKLQTFLKTALNNRNKLLDPLTFFI